MPFFFLCSQRSNNGSNQSLNQEPEHIFHKDKNCKLTMSTEIKPTEPKLKFLPSLQKGNKNLFFSHDFELRAHNMCKSTNFHDVISRIKISRSCSRGCLYSKIFPALFSEQISLTGAKQNKNKKPCCLSYCENMCSQLTLVNAKTQANVILKKSHANI